MAILKNNVARYLLGVAAAWLVMSLLCAAICIFADPYRLFGTPAIKGLSGLKPRFDQQAMMAKTYRLDHSQVRTLLLGNSRTEVGLNPESAEWPSAARPVFNASLSGQDLYPALLLLKEAIANSQVKTVVLEVDFQDFLTEPVNKNYQPPASEREFRLKLDRLGHTNRARNWQILKDWWGATLTLDALYDSVVTLAGQDEKFGRTITASGFSPQREYGLEVRQIGYSGLFSQKLASYRQQYAHSPHPDFIQPDQIENFQYLWNIIRIAAEHRIALKIFVPPYHAQLLDLISSRGFWPEFENWKRALAQTVFDQNRAHPEAKIELVDFSGYNRYTQEPVPAAGDTVTQMRWYWEAGHFKSALGDKIIHRMTTGSGDFGEALTPETVESVMARERAGEKH